MENVETENVETKEAETEDVETEVVEAESVETGIYEIVVILSSPSYKQLKRARSTVSEMMTCNQMFNHVTGAVAFWWKGRPLMPFQENGVKSLIAKVYKLGLSEFHIINISDKGKVTKLGGFHDHPFEITFRTTLEVNDGR